MIYFTVREVGRFAFDEGESSNLENLKPIKTLPPFAAKHPDRKIDNAILRNGDPRYTRMS